MVHVRHSGMHYRDRPEPPGAGSGGRTTAGTSSWKRALGLGVESGRGRWRAGTRRGPCPGGRWPRRRGRADRQGPVGAAGRRGRPLEQAGQHVPPSSPIQQLARLAGLADQLQGVTQAEEGLAGIGLEPQRGAEVADGRWAVAAGQGEPATEPLEPRVIVGSGVEQGPGGGLIAPGQQELDPLGTRLWGPTRARAPGAGPPGQGVRAGGRGRSGPAAIGDRPGLPRRIGPGSRRPRPAPSPRPG